jgi:hypothetical protein
MKYVSPSYVFDGEKVIIPWPTPENPRQGVWVTVACAAGRLVRVVHKNLGVDRWFRIEELSVPVNDPRAGSSQRHGGEP